MTSYLRRRFLLGAGAAVALPLWQSRPALPSERLLAKTKNGAPLRLLFVQFPNGAIESQWWPKGSGESFELAATMAALSPFKKSLQIMGGLDHAEANPGPDGAGDHARAGGTFLTGVRVRRTAGADIRAGISADQVVAAQVGQLTRFPSLELTCDASRKSGSCDSGYSCAYQYNMAWSTPTTPVAPEPSPRLVFERLFGTGEHGERQANLKRRQERQKSILDFVTDDARALKLTMQTRDKQKLDEYLTGMREVEGRIARVEKLGAAPDPDVKTPVGVPDSYEEYIQLMYDLVVLALTTDSTRVATLLLSNEGNNRSFPEIGLAEGHHHLSHHQNRKDMIDKVAQIDRFFVKQFARFLEKMSKTKDSDGKSLLENSMIVYGSAHSDGNRHSHLNLPVIVAGNGGGILKAGRFVKHGDVPMTNLFLSLADRMGVEGVLRLGDSTGRLKDV